MTFLESAMFEPVKAVLQKGGNDGDRCRSKNAIHFEDNKKQ